MTANAEAGEAGAASPAKPRLTHRETLWIVFGVLVPVLMASIDQTIVATSLPTIGQDLGDIHYLPWVVAVYLLTMTAATPLYGKFSDIKGRQVTLVTSIVIFMIGGIASALAPSMTWLVAARALQGIGNGGLVSQAMTVLGDVASPKERARYYTYFSITYTSAGAIGPALGGFFAEYLHWRASFWIAVPLSLLSLTLAFTLLGKLPRNEKPHRLDVLGALLIVLASSTSMFVLNAGGKVFAWTSPEVLGTAVISLTFWLLFVRRLLTTPEPLIPLGILRNPIVRMSTMANAIGWGSIISLNIYLPLYLQSVLGMSPASAGLHLMVLMVTVNSSALVGAQVAARVVHYKRYPMATLAVSILAMIYLTWRLDRVSAWEFEILLAIIGIGFGPMAPVSTVATQNAVQLSQLGTAISMMSFSRSLMASMLVAGVGAVILHAIGTSGDARASADQLVANREAAIVAFRIMFSITVLCLTIALAAFWRMEEKPLQATNEGRG
ncbi:MAG: MFS transporter [Beijerinckiaceae bacterium]